MKSLHLFVTSGMVALATLAFAPKAYAFHSGGVAECSGCHAMHKADSTGAIIGTTNANLLNNSHISSTCLDCHAASPAGSSYHIMTQGTAAAGVTPGNFTPGGDFGWLAKTYTFLDRDGVTVIDASPGGHAVNAPEYGINGSTELAPGGSFPGSQLACTSCHDPHGKARTDANGNFVSVASNKIIGSGSYPTLPPAATGETNVAYGTYRLLYTNNSYYTTNYVGPVPATLASVTFNTAPLAVAPATYNSATGEATNQIVVRYANLPSRSMSLWCASCHTNMHTANSGKFTHPIDVALNTGGELGYYNAYRNSGSKTGTLADAYLTLVPFAMDGATRAQLAAGADNAGSAGSKVGAGTGDTVMCLSCHRAHASGFTSATRWETENEFITAVSKTGVLSWPGTDFTGNSIFQNRGKTVAETTAAYYNRPVTQFGGYQRSLCNKCHAQD